MEHTAYTELSGVVLRMTDPVLLSLCRAELLAMRLPELLPPPSGTVAVVDLDDKSTASTVGDGICIGISRREAALPPSLIKQCLVVLHRPFPLDAYRRAIRDALRALEAHDPPAQARRRMTARRTRSDHRLRLSESGQTLLAGGTEIPLTPGEMTVFLSLYEANGETVSRDALSRALGGDGHSNLPDVHVCAIRKKLARYGKDVLLQAVRGKGYRLLLNRI